MCQSFSFMISVFCVLCKKYLSTPKSWKSFLLEAYVLAFRFISQFHLELIFVYTLR